MADAGDLKSPFRKEVRVRAPLPARLCERTRNGFRSRKRLGARDGLGPWRGTPLRGALRPGRPSRMRLAGRPRVLGGARAAGVPRVRAAARRKRRPVLVERPRIQTAEPRVPARQDVRRRADRGGRRQVFAARRRRNARNLPVRFRDVGRGVSRRRHAAVVRPRTQYRRRRNAVLVRLPPRVQRPARRRRFRRLENRLRQTVRAGAGGLRAVVPPDRRVRPLPSRKRPRTSAAARTFRRRRHFPAQRREVRDAVFPGFPALRAAHGLGKPPVRRLLASGAHRGSVRLHRTVVRPAVPRRKARGPGDERILLALGAGESVAFRLDMQFGLS